MAGVSRRAGPVSEDFAARLAQVRARYVGRLAEARDELAAGPPPERMIFLAHNLAGSGATYGFDAVSDRAMALEAALNAGDDPGVHIESLLSALSSALAQA